MTRLLDIDDAAFPSQVDRLLAEYGSLRKVVAATGDNYDATYDRIRTLGYRLTGRLVPVNAPALESDRQPRNETAR